MRHDSRPPRKQKRFPETLTIGCSIAPLIRLSQHDCSSENIVKVHVEGEARVGDLVHGGCNMKEDWSEKMQELEQDRDHRTYTPTFAQSVWENPTQIKAWTKSIHRVEKTKSNANPNKV